ARARSVAQPLRLLNTGVRRGQAPTMSTTETINLTLASLALLTISFVAHAEDRVTPGEPTVEPPTLISLGIDWPIEGDDNRNASVGVEYRRSGESAWHRALPLFRLQNEQVNGRVGGPSFVDAAKAAESAAAHALSRCSDGALARCCARALESRRRSCECGGHHRCVCVQPVLICRAEHVLGQRLRSRARHLLPAQADVDRSGRSCGRGAASAARAHARGAEARGRRQDLSRLSRRL